MDVPVSDLRAHLRDWLDRVREGEDVTITDRGSPVARIVLHLASALAVGDADLLVATWDRRFATATRASGLTVTPPPD